MIAGVTANNDRAGDRLAGVRAALDEAGLAGARLPIVEARYSLAEGARACAELLALWPRPTALICGNDVLAAGAIGEARRRGLRLPEQLSVTGFDDIDLAEVVVPHRRMGVAAARALLAMRDGRVQCRGEELRTHLVMRGSLAPPGA